METVVRFGIVGMFVLQALFDWFVYVTVRELAKSVFNLSQMKGGIDGKG